MEKPREIAVDLLLDREKGRFVEVLLDERLQSAVLKPEDKRLLQELVYGVVRWQATLDWLIQTKTGGRPQKPVIQNLLRLALYQMFWLERVPSYAAVNDSVEICKRRGFVPQAKFVNAVLRACGREAEALKGKLAEYRVSHLALGHSHPDWLIQRWLIRWGKEKVIQLLDWNNSTPPTYARVNTLRVSPAALQERWKAEGVEFEATECTWTPSDLMFHLRKHPPLEQLQSLQEGWFYVQDPSTLSAVEMLQPKAGESMLDLCAAPGGKTTYLAQKIQNQGKIHASDLDPDRLKMVAANCARLGAESVSIQPLESITENIFDRILIDAPCSNTGVMRRRVELRWRITPEEIQRLSRTQLQLLGRAAKLLRIGGTLVYSTCSLEQEENQAVVREFLDTHRKFRLEAEQELTPMANGVDGAYSARLGLAT